MSSKKSTQDLQDECDLFNTQYDVGTPGILHKDDGTRFPTATRSPAQVLSGHTAVIWVTAVAGCYALDRFEPEEN